MLKPIGSNQMNWSSHNSKTNQSNAENRENNAKNISKVKSGVVLDINNAESKPVIYGDKKKSMVSVSVDELWNTSAQFVENFKALVKDLLSKQGVSAKNIQLGKKIEFDKINKESIDIAKEAISENGEFGVKKVAERIMDFAKILANGDKEKIPELREAVETGFKEAEKILGGLPEISGDTYNLVMEEFDKWESEELNNK